MNLIIVPGILVVCRNFLIRVCIFTVSKALLISSATVIVRAGGTIWLNPFATVLFFFVFFFVEKMIYLNQQNYIQDSRNKRH